MINSHLRIISLMLIIVFLLGLCSCGDIKDEITFLPDYYVCDYYEFSNTFAFNMLYLYKGDFPTIEISSVITDSNNASILSFENKNSTEFEKTKGYRMGYICINILCDEPINVREITMLVNGSTTTVTFDRALTVRKPIDNMPPCVDGLIIGTAPFMLLCDGKKTIESIRYDFTATKDLRIFSFNYTNFIEVVDSMVVVDGVNKGTIEEAFPLDLPSGSTMSIRIAEAFLDDYQFTDLTVSMLLKYALYPDLDEIKIYYDTNVLLGITSQSSYEKFIDHWLNNNN